MVMKGVKIFALTKRKERSQMGSEEREGGGRGGGGQEERENRHEKSEELELKADS